eukprot:5095558-Prymnesium_polylepis.1
MAFSVASEQQVTTGRWGEQLIARYLLATVAAAEGTWVNEAEESGLPYDILVTERSEGMGWGRESYIEVKATNSADKPLFEMSVAELEFAQKQGASYSLYRVFSACSNSVRVLKLQNVARSLARGGLVLYAGSPGALDA